MRKILERESDLLKKMGRGNVKGKQNNSLTES